MAGHWATCGGFPLRLGGGCPAESLRHTTSDLQMEVLRGLDSGLRRGLSQRGPHHGALHGAVSAHLLFLRHLEATVPALCHAMGLRETASCSPGTSPVPELGGHLARPPPGGTWVRAAGSSEMHPEPTSGARTCSAGEAGGGGPPRCHRRQRQGSRRWSLSSGDTRVPPPPRFRFLKVLLQGQLVSRSITWKIPELHSPRVSCGSCAEEHRALAPSCALLPGP